MRGRDAHDGRRGTSVRHALAAGAVAVAAGCSLLSGTGPAGGGGTAGVDTAGADGEGTNDAAAAASVDSAARAGGSVAAADSAYLTLLDSARTLSRGGGEPAARPQPDSAAGDEKKEAKSPEDGYPAGPVTITDVEKLKELGPVYTPYDRGPILGTRNERLDGLLKATIVPVIRRHELAPDEWARYWVLVDAEGRVRDSVLQLPSGHSSFDAAARAVAENLRFAPAHRNDAAVPVWILTRVSLLMR